MGKKLDALFGRSFKSQKLKSLLNLSLTRLSILKNQRQVRFSQATSDVSELLKLGQHESAFHRIDQVIKNQNMLDVFVFIHGYCNVLLDHVHLLEQHKDRECPEELLEAVSSLLFAASRIGEFPELQHIRNVLISRFGKELAARSIELRCNCGVNIRMVQKLSTRQPPKELRMKVLKEIAAEKNIVLKLEESSTSNNQETLEVSKAKLTIENRGEDYEYEVSDSVKRGKKKYKDVADAAQAAFESAAHAAAAARAAVELSQFSPRGPVDNRDYPDNFSGKKSSNDSENKIPESDQEQGNDFSEAEGSIQGSKRSMSDSEETIDEVSVSLMSFREDPVKLLEKDVAIYDSSEEETTYDDVKSSNTKVKDELDPMVGPNGVDVVHLDHMVRLGGSPISRKVGMKGPVSVRTRRVRGY